MLRLVACLVNCEDGKILTTNDVYVPAPRYELERYSYGKSVEDIEVHKGYFKAINEAFVYKPLPVVKSLFN